MPFAELRWQFPGFGPFTVTVSGLDTEIDAMTGSPDSTGSTRKISSPVPGGVRKQGKAT